MKPDAAKLSWKDWKAIKDLARTEHWYLKTKAFWYLLEYPPDWLKRAF